MKSPKKSVLIVDDNPHLCSLIQDGLSECGFDCRVITDSKKAVDLLEIGDYSVLVTDIVMPHVTGLDLLIAARRHAPRCKVILTTGALSGDYLAQALMLGAYDYVEKPFDVLELTATVLRAISEDIGMAPLSQRAAAAMQVSSRTDKVALESVRALARAVEAKDPYTRRHSEHVAYYSKCLATVLDVPPEDSEVISNSSLLHDIGKIGVPDSILTKSAGLTGDEFEYIRRHPALGADILSNITLFKHVPAIVRHHHERWDGNGYPDGLVGEEIPWASRLINVADSIDAMLMERTYKAAYSVDKMMDQLQGCAGQQFDPIIAGAAFSWCRDNANRLILPTRPIEVLVA
jgi:putative two-component system response regulator